MKTTLKFFLFFLFIINYGCNNDEGILCFTEPAPYSFELVDKTTGKNLLTNGTFKSTDIVVKDLDDSSKNVKFDIISENNLNVIRFGYIGWETENINYSVSIHGKNIYDFHVKATRVNNKCSYTEYKDFKIENAAYEFDKTNGVYKIFVDPEI